MDFCRFFYFILYFNSFWCGMPVVSVGCCCLCCALCLRAYGLFFLFPPLVRKNPSFFSCAPCLYGLILSFFSISPYQSLKIFSVKPGNFNTLRTNALICYFESVTFSVKKLKCGDSPQNNTDCSVIFQSQSVLKSFFQLLIY